MKTFIFVDLDFKFRKSDLEMLGYAFQNSFFFSFGGIGV
jgi:hypothetical protein